MSSKLLQLDNLIEGVVMKRPSKIIKTPYVADIIINPESKETVLGHTASLGCCGLADVGAHILMAPVPKTKQKAKKAHNSTKGPSEDKPSCEYRVYLSILREKDTEIIIGIYPKLAEELTLSALKNNQLSSLQNIQSYKRETKICVPGLVDSRFDLSGIDANGIPFIMEIKNVPLADYEDVCAKDRKKMCFDDREFNSKVAYFPDGYRKKSTDPVSPRALKHINELALIKSMSKTRCIMCYVIQRTDVNRFQPSIIDPEYRNAFIKARDAGVEMITMVVEWRRDGAAYFVKDDLEISLLKVEQ
jgi:DNA-binding sugar fermentation-stimulating protein